MGESLNRIKGWVQKHPLLAALILGAVILAGYLVYRSRAGGGGGGAAGGGTEEPGVAPGEQGTVPSPVPLPIPQPVETGGGGGGQGQYLGPPISGKGHIGHIGNINPGVGGGMSFSPDMTGIGDYGLPIQIPHQPTFVALDPYSSGPGGKRKVHPPAQVFVSPAEASYSSGPGGKSHGKNLNPAQQAGKGRNFTGFINGVYYVNGYPSPQVFLQGNTVISTTGNVAPVVTGGKHKA